MGAGAAPKVMEHLKPCMYMYIFSSDTGEIISEVKKTD